MSDPVNATGRHALIALTRRELVRFIRQPTRVAATLGTAALLWVFLASGFARAPGQGPAYGVFLVPGMISLTVVFSAMFAALSLIEDRNEGFLQAVLVSPTPRWALAGSKVAGSSLIAAAQGAVLLPGALVVGSPAGPGGYALALLGVALTAVAISALGLAAAWRVNSVQGFHGVMNLVLMPMWLLSGAFIPIEGASGWLRVVMLANPLTWLSASVRAALGAGSLPGPLPLVWLVSFALAGVSVALAARTLGRADD